MWGLCLCQSDVALYPFLVLAVLRVKSVDHGVVVIQGTEAGRYLAMSSEGKLYSSVSIKLSV